MEAFSFFLYLSLFFFSRCFLSLERHGLDSYTGYMIPSRKEEGLEELAFFFFLSFIWAGVILGKSSFFLSSPTGQTSRRSDQKDPVHAQSFSRIPAHIVRFPPPLPPLLSRSVRWSVSRWSHTSHRID